MPEFGSEIELGLALVVDDSCMKLHPDWSIVMCLDVMNASVGVVEVRVGVVCKLVWA